MNEGEKKLTIKATKSFNVELSQHCGPRGAVLELGITLRGSGEKETIKILVGAIPINGNPVEGGVRISGKI